MTQVTRMSVNAGTVQLVFTALSLEEMPPLDLVMPDITVRQVHPVEGRSPVPLEHTVKEQTRNPNCVQLEPSSQTSLEGVFRTASIALQGFIVLPQDFLT